MSAGADLDNLRVVLVCTRNPLNIGAAARAMSNFGFAHLRVVTPYERLAIEDGSRFIRMMYHGEVYDNYDQFMDDQTREHGAPCSGCPLRADCGGVYLEYAERRGWSEFAAARRDFEASSVS